MSRGVEPTGGSPLPREPGMQPDSLPPLALPLCLELRETPDKGRGIFYVGKAPCAPGTLLLETLPYAYVLHRDRWDTTCQTCFCKSEKELQRCGRCHFVRYCGETCQREDWKLYHKTEVRVARAVPSAVC